MPEQLPPEIIDRILDYLYDEGRTLAVCALAGRVMLPTARFHRFNSVKLYPGQIQALMSLIESAPDLACAITKVTIRTVKPDSPLDRSLLMDFISRLPALCALAIPTALSELFTRNTGSPSNHRVPPLTYLSLFGYPSFISPTELLQCISAFSTLEKIILVHVKMPIVPDEDVPYTLPPPPRLHHVKSRKSDGVSVITRWLQAHSIAHGVRSWDELITEPEDARRFSAASGLCANTLQDLQIIFIPLGRMAAALRGADFSHSRFSALESCTLRFAFGEMCVAENESLSEIPPLLSQLSSPTLRTLTVSLVVDNVEDLRSLNSECAVRTLSPAYFDDMRVLDWSAIERALTSEGLGALRTFVLEGQGDPQLLESHIRTTCPELYARGLVSLVAADMKNPWWPNLTP
ncbi:hypothetical protein OH77DRAFT_1478441 [Trametes cingulata]|nr:hypothetical protein OH77DRAFT_1478441 [Trametes cingulata]